MSQHSLLCSRPRYRCRSSQVRPLLERWTSPLHLRGRRRPRMASSSSSSPPAALHAPRVSSFWQSQCPCRAVTPSAESAWSRSYLESRRSVRAVTPPVTPGECRVVVTCWMAETESPAASIRQRVAVEWVPKSAPLPRRWRGCCDRHHGTRERLKLYSNCNHHLLLGNYIAVESK